MKIRFKVGDRIDRLLVTDVLGRETRSVAGRSSVYMPRYMTLCECGVSEVKAQNTLLYRPERIKQCRRCAYEFRVNEPLKKPVKQPFTVAEINQMWRPINV